MSIAILQHTETTGTVSGSIALNAWTTRKINTVHYDPGGIVSLSNNEFTLQAGTYLVITACSVYRLGNHRGRIYNVTDAVSIGHSETQRHATIYSSGRSRLVKAFTLTASKALAWQDYHDANSFTNMLGVDGGDTTAPNEVYAQIQIEKL